MNRLRLELRKKYRDMFKILQFVMFSMIGCLTVPVRMMAFWGEKYSMYQLNMIPVTFVQVLSYITSNQICWIVLIYHLVSYREVPISSEYNEIRTKVIKFEKWIMGAYLFTYFF